MASSTSSKGSSSNQAARDEYSIQMRQAKRRGAGKGSKMNQSVVQESHEDLIYRTWAEKFFNGNSTIAEAFDRIQHIADPVVNAELINRGSLQKIGRAHV